MLLNRAHPRRTIATLTSTVQMSTYTHFQNIVHLSKCPPGMAATKTLAPTSQQAIDFGDDRDRWLKTHPMRRQFAKLLANSLH